MSAHRDHSGGISTRDEERLPSATAEPKERRWAQALRTRAPIGAPLDENQRAHTRTPETSPALCLHLSSSQYVVMLPSSPPMRTALALPAVVALALAPARASADPPSVSVRLEYVRGSGGEACPAEPTTLRAEVAARMGYDPFEGASTPERLAVVMMAAAKGRGFVARVERFNAAGESTWSETFPPRPLQGSCAALMSPLASYLRALFLSYQGGPASPPAVPLPEPAVSLPTPAAPVPSPPAAPARELRAPPVQLADPPAPPSVPNPTRATARDMAIVAYAVGGAFLGLGIAWTVDAQNKDDAAQALRGQNYRSGGTTGCTTGAVSGGKCDRVLGAWQSRDTALNLRNGWFAAAGVSVAVGAVATIWALNLPTTIKGPPQTQVRLTPCGLVISGAF